MIFRIQAGPHDRIACRDRHRSYIKSDRTSYKCFTVHFVLVKTLIRSPSLMTIINACNLCGGDGWCWPAGGRAPGQGPSLRGKPLPIGNFIGCQFGRSQACLIMRSRFPKHIYIFQPYLQEQLVHIYWEYYCPLMNFHANVISYWLYYFLELSIDQFYMRSFLFYIYLFSPTY
jgi:hypothetical protein